MLTFLKDPLVVESYKKYCVIFSDHTSVCRAIDQSLVSFGINEDFSRTVFETKNIASPEWAENRDFDVGGIKISVSSVRDGNFSCYFCNLDDCWFSLFLRITSILKCDSLMVRSSPSSAGPDEYIQELTVFKSGEKSRVLRVSYDDEWQFYQFGQPLSFEDAACLGRRKKKDRLSRDYLFLLVDKLIEKNSKLLPPFLNCQWERHGIGHKAELR